MYLDIDPAVKRLIDRRESYNQAEIYYKGTESEIFANSKWRKMLKAGRSDYVLNYAKVVVDTVHDRLELASVQGVDDASNEAINRIWEQNELTLDAQEMHRQALVFGDCYAIVWPDENGDVQITYNSPKTTVLIYDDENPRIKRYASKVWETNDSFGHKKTYLTLYFDDRVEKYVKEGELSTTNAQSNWSLIETVDNPFGEVPVFHFRTHKPYGTPEHAAAIGPQNAINKLVVNHMETVDYHGAPQRYALSGAANSSEFEDFDNDDTARENMNALRNGPGELWYLQGVAAVGQFPAADPKTFIDPMMAYVKSMASLTQTPLHYFQNNGQFASGEALRTAEAPLTKKVRNRQLSFGSTWRDIFRFALKIEGILVDVQIKWANVESIDTADAWSIATLKRGLGMRLQRVLTEMGYDEEVAEEVMAEYEQDYPEGLVGLNSGTGLGLNTHNLAAKAAAEATD